MTRNPDAHLTDSDLFALAAPASGEPQPLPPHLSRCEACSRALQEWRTAVRELAREDAAAVEARPEEEWEAAREATMAAVRRSRPKAAGQALRWAAGIAAAVVLVLLAMPARRSAAPASTAPADDMALSSASDREDDRFLREAAYLAQGGDDNADVGLEDSL